MQCVGSYPNQCTACGEGRTLLKTPGKAYGECPADSVVSNNILQQRLQEQRDLLKQQRAELKTLTTEKMLSNQMDIKLSKASLASQTEQEAQQRVAMLGEGNDALEEADDTIKLLSPSKDSASLDT